MSPKIWLRHADPSERLDPRLREAVELELRKILPFRRDRLGDDTAAVEVMEEVVRSASKRAAFIRNPRWYIFTSALRRLKRVVRRSPQISYVDPAKLESFAATNPYHEIDAKLLCDEIRAHLPEKEFAFLMSALMRECTWEQLGSAMGLSADAARKKYDRLINSLREWLSKSARPERQ